MVLNVRVTLGSVAARNDGTVDCAPPRQLPGLCKLHCSAASTMNRDVLLLGDKLDVVGVHAAPIEAPVMVLPPPGTVWRGLNRDRSIHFGPCNPIGVFCPAPAWERDRGVAALARMTSIPVKAPGYRVDGVLAFQAGGSTCSGSFHRHVHCPRPARWPESSRSRAIEG
jgi:hypothetical protein